MNVSAIGSNAPVIAPQQTGAASGAADGDPKTGAAAASKAPDGDADDAPAAAPSSPITTSSSNVQAALTSLKLGG